MLGYLKRGAIVTLAVGAVIGAALTLATDEMNKITATDAFCTSCHAMAAYVAEDPVYQRSTHRVGTKGVRAGCKDCHLPDANIVTETWVHASMGVKDIVALFRHDYDNPAVWNAERTRMAYTVRDRMKANDSAVCRTCHDDTAIAPETKAGRDAHEQIVKTGEKTCIQCHFNLVHAPVKPRLEFIRARNTAK